MRWRIGRRGVLDPQFVVVVPTVVDRRLQRAGVAFVTIGTGQLKANPDRNVGFVRFGFPILVTEVLVATVEVVFAMVHRDVVGFAIDRKLSLLDPVAETAYGTAEVT